MKKLYINGRFLTQKLSGVQRAGIELVKELDKIVDIGKVEILTPPGIIHELKLSNITIKTIGSKSNNFWIQWSLPLYVKRHNGILLTLAGLYPLIMPGYYLIYDTTLKRYPKSFKWIFRSIYDLVYKMSLNRCNHLFTISEFSKREISSIYHISSRRFTIVYCSSNQMIPDLQYIDQQNLDRWRIASDRYFLSVSNRNRHKNQIYIERLAKKYPTETFVIVGGRQDNAFNSVDNVSLQNVIYTGYVNEKELKCLYTYCKGFIFPSLYEGFGIPPLEAIVMGAKHVAVSDIPVFREIYNKGCYFFDPNDVDSFEMNDFLKLEMTSKMRDYYIGKYSWKKSAECIWNTICDCEQTWHRK